MSEHGRQMARLQRIIDAQTAIVQSDLDLEGFMQSIVDILKELTEAQGAVIELIDGEWMEYRRASGLVAMHVGLRLRRDGSLSGLSVAAKETLCCEDTELDARVDKEACQRIGVRSMICAPLFQLGQPVGVLKVMSDRCAAFDIDDIQTLTLLAGVLGAALGKQLAFDALQATERRMRSLLENATDAIVSLDEQGCLLRWNVAAEKLFGLPATGVLGRPLAELGTIAYPALASIFACEPATGHAAYREFEFVGPHGQLLTIEFTLTRNRFGNAFELTAFIHDVTSRKHMEQSMRDMALTDGLTGVANRRKITDVLDLALGRAKRGQGSMALLFMDLNEFKSINDSYGHETGDRVLQAFASRLQSCVRAADVVGRLGGDEFVVLAEGVKCEADALVLARKIVAVLEPALGEGDITLATSIGIAMYQQQENVQQWLGEADRAMYQAKHRGGEASRIAVYAAVRPTVLEH